MVLRLSTFPSDVRGVALAGFSTASSALATAADTVLSALGKLQAQMSLAAPLASPTFTGAVALGTATATTPPVGTNTTAVATTAFVLGQASTATPPLNGAASAGVATAWSRADHVHPKQTISLLDYGADPTGTTDTTAAVNAWISAVMAAGARGYAPVGTYLCASQITMNWSTALATGAIFHGDGTARTVFKITATTSPAWLMTAGSAAAFYGQFLDIGISASVAGPVLQIGLESYADAFNGFTFRTQTWNANTTSSACGIEINGAYNCDIIVTTNNSGYGDSMRCRYMAFCRVFGSISNANIGLHLTSYYVFGNIFEAIDFEVLDICVQIDTASASNNTWLGGQFVWNNNPVGTSVAAIVATAGSNNRFIGGNFGSNTTYTSGATGIIIQGLGIGTETFGGLLTSALSFGSQLAASPTDLSKQVALYSSSYGFSVTSGRLNYNSGGWHVMLVGGVSVGMFTSTGLNAAAIGATTSASGAFTTLSATAGGSVTGGLAVDALTVSGNATAAALILGSGGPTITSGAGVPTSTQPSGSIYLRTGGATGSRLYATAGGGTWAAVAGV